MKKKTSGQYSTRDESGKGLKLYLLFYVISTKKKYIFIYRHICRNVLISFSCNDPKTPS